MSFLFPVNTSTEVPVEKLDFVTLILLTISSINRWSATAFFETIDEKNSKKFKNHGPHGNAGKIGTPPNAIAYGTGFVSMGAMARTGLLLSGALALLLAAGLASWIPAVIERAGGETGGDEGAPRVPKWATEACA